MWRWPRKGIVHSLRSSKKLRATGHVLRWLGKFGPAETAKVLTQGDIAQHIDALVAEPVNPFLSRQQHTLAHIEKLRMQLHRCTHPRADLGHGCADLIDDLDELARGQGGASW